MQQGRCNVLLSDSKHTLSPPLLVREGPADASQSHHAQTLGHLHFATRGPGTPPAAYPGTLC